MSRTESQLGPGRLGGRRGPARPEPAGELAALPDRPEAALRGVPHRIGGHDEELVALPQHGRGPRYEALLVPYDEGDRRSGREPQLRDLDAVHPGILEASETRREEPGKGEAHFYTIKTLTADGPDEAWYYPYAEGDYGPIRDLLTFGGKRVKVSVSEV